MSAVPASSCLLWGGFSQFGNATALNHLLDLMLRSRDYQGSEQSDDAFQAMMAAAGLLDPAPDIIALAGFARREAALGAFLSGYDTIVDARSNESLEDPQWSVEAGLIQFRRVLQSDAGSDATLEWLDALPWSNILSDARIMDHAVQELCAGRALLDEDGAVIARDMDCARI
ncbi:hypothetical protein AA0472_2470 [Acetobacter estunensis NRIC 0472]|uniref:Uncharacterized protein n=1 Tax=Acetobacter estunensis TaxID=104097 RepID=A0A967B904_9PROT|nr:hypothetical protein [Acetobacter estunensis]NHO54930.1 hypothetical protein [Acetobacter estunensis]GBQ27662.1 hypothetical protein AA0472_2470 [Acetobacter estunensis NRIC 0472]